MDYILVALRSPELDGEKTMTLDVDDEKNGKVYVIRYGDSCVIQRDGNCRVYDEDEIENVLRVDLGRVLCVGKTRYVSKDVRRYASASDIKNHLAKFDAGSERVRIARLTFQTKRGLTADSLVVTYDGDTVVVEHRSKITVTRDDRPMISSVEFKDVDVALRCVEDNLAFCDDHAIVELGYETKRIEIKMLDTC